MFEKTNISVTLTGFKFRQGRLSATQVDHFVGESLGSDHIKQGLL